MSVPTGTRFGDCEILGPLGAGGMGEVYRARDHSLGREVAIKLLPGELASDPGRLHRFEQEARAAAALNHPNIVVVYRFGTEEQGTPYLVTELLQGQTLRERLKTGPVGVRKTIEYALQIARGLAAAHDRGIVHRDLKPENIFLTRDGQIKILDFGLAKLTHPEPDNTETRNAMSATDPGLVMGTAGYMSPEQVRGQAVDARSDIFALGAIVYEMLSGRRAFQGATPADTMSAILKDDPPEFTSSMRELPPALARIVDRCLEKDAAERFQSARDLAFYLDLLTHETHSSGVAAAVAPKSRLKWHVPVVAALALLLAAIAGLVLSRWLRPSTGKSAPVVLRRLTDFVGMEEFPALSPDGKSAAFTADVGGRRQVWVRLLAGGTPLQITHDDADHQSPRWASDSSSLMYFSPSKEPDGQGNLWDVPALGGPNRPLVASLGGGDISHDGKHIAYFRAQADGVELTIADRDGSNPNSVTKLNNSFTYSYLRWSPDDRMLGFQQGRVFSYDIFYVRANGGDPKPITRDNNILGGFAWLPDSSGVIYSSARGDTVLYLPTMNLWSARVGGTEPRQLTFGETSYTSPDLDSKGNLVASRSRMQFDIWKYPVGGTPKENVERGVQITHQTGAVQTPSAGPGDKELVYLSDSGGHGNVWILNLQDGRSRQITFEQDPRIALGVPVWAPDGEHIAYVTRSRTVWNVDQWVVHPDGTDARKFSEGGGWANWSADSRWLYFAEPKSEGGYRLIKASVDDGHRVTVREEGERPAISSSGTVFYTVQSANLNGVSDLEILQANPETAPSRPLAHIPGSRLPPYVLMQPVLSPDGKWLAMLLTDGPTTNIWAQPTAGGALRQITDFGNQATFIARRVSWSSDGHSIYAAVGKGDADIVLLSHLQP